MTVNPGWGGQAFIRARWTGSARLRASSATASRSRSTAASTRRRRALRGGGRELFVAGIGDLRVRRSGAAYARNRPPRPGAASRIKKPSPVATICSRDHDCPHRRRPPDVPGDRPLLLEAEGYDVIGEAPDGTSGARRGRAAASGPRPARRQPARHRRVRRRLAASPAATAPRRSSWSPAATPRTSGRWSAQRRAGVHPEGRALGRRDRGAALP